MRLESNEYGQFENICKESSDILDGFMRYAPIIQNTSVNYQWSKEKNASLPRPIGDNDR